MSTSPADFNTQVIDEFHANEGRVGGAFEGIPILPGWYHNVKAHPNVTIEVGTETIDVVASETTGEERARLFRTQAERSELGHRLFEFERELERLIPVIAFTPR